MIDTSLVTSAKKTIYTLYTTKHILNVQKHCDGGWFWSKYSAYPYVGCEYGCMYCYSRDEKYNPHKRKSDPNLVDFADPFSEYIKVKENAPESLKKALQNKPRGLIYLDSHQPIDSQYRYARKMLEVCVDLQFPVFINEKSPSLLCDLDVLKKINEISYLNVGWSMISARDDDARLVVEPHAPSIHSRFTAMKTLAQNGIMTGTVFMPVLPFLYDDEENIEAIVRETKNSGGSYVLEGGLTLWGYCKTFFYKALENYDASLLEKYEHLYTDQKQFIEHNARVHRLILKYCQKYNISSYIPRPVAFYPEHLRRNKEIAGKLYLEARELQLSGNSGYKEWAYRKAAWALDELTENIETVYKKNGLDGLKHLRGIGDILSKKIEILLQEEAKQ